MEPQRVVEARQHQPRVEHEAAMSDQCGIEQREVRGVGEYALVERQVVAQLARRPQPDLLGRRPVLRREIAGEVDRPDLDRPLPLPIGFDLRRHPVDQRRLQLRFAG